MPNPVPSAEAQITQWLKAWRDGDNSAEQRLIEAVYSHLHEMAARMMGKERPEHTLRPTALVHEAWLRMCGSEVDYQNRAHFLSLSAIVMRRILVDYARARASAKRIGARKRISMEEAAMTVVMEQEAGPEQLLDLDRALTELAVQDARKGRLMEMIYFGGMEPEEAAAVLHVSLRTAQREIRFSKLWLKTAMQG